MLSNAGNIYVDHNPSSFKICELQKNILMGTSHVDDHITRNRSLSMSQLAMCMFLFTFTIPPTSSV